MIPWGTVQTDPWLVVLVPFAWLVWQLYVPRVVDAVVGDPKGRGHAYETWWTTTKQQFHEEFDRVDERVNSIGDDVETIADTQQELIHVTVAQSKLMNNGHDKELEVDAVKQNLMDDHERSPDDYLSETTTPSSEDYYAEDPERTPTPREQARKRREQRAADERTDESEDTE